jgi:hypothetical protein
VSGDHFHDRNIRPWGIAEPRVGGHRHALSRSITRGILLHIVLLAETFSCTLDSNAAGYTSASAGSAGRDRA